MNGSIEVVLCPRDQKGLKIRNGGKRRFISADGEQLGKMADKFITKGVRKPYRVNALDRFYCEGDFALNPEE